MPELLERDKTGVQNIFRENVTSKKTEEQNVGYGCYIAFEISKRCGWDLKAENLNKGCKFIITIKNQ